jgi:hypothetical protein
VWCIWYDDGTTLEGVDSADAAQAPGAGVVCVAQPNVLSHGAQQTQVLEGFDWYLWEENQWHVSNAWGLYRYLTKPGYKVVKMGGWVPKPLFESYLAEAARWNG